MRGDTLCCTTFSSKLSFREVLSSKTKKKPKLVWARFGQFWWPAILYPNLKEFDADVRSKLVSNTDPTSYTAFQIHLKALIRFNKGSSHEVILFLGRSLHDFRIVRGRDKRKHYRCFFDRRKTKKMHKSVICKPESFAMNKNEYFAFHLGLDEAMKRSDKHEGCRVSYSKQAFNAWGGF
jgi:hypothetical protein